MCAGDDARRRRRRWWHRRCAKVEAQWGSGGGTRGRRHPAAASGPARGLNLSRVWLRVAVEADLPIVACHQRERRRGRRRRGRRRRGRRRRRHRRRRLRWNVRQSAGHLSSRLLQCAGNESAVRRRGGTNIQFALIGTRLIARRPSQCESPAAATRQAAVAVDAVRPAHIAAGLPGVLARKGLYITGAGYPGHVHLVDFAADRRTSAGIDLGCGCGPGPGLHRIRAARDPCVAVPSHGARILANWWRLARPR